MPELLNSDRKFSSPEHEQFYEELTVSASAYIDPVLQEKFRNTRILVAGVGSVGNPIAMMAVRSGAENLVVTDPDGVEDSNLARQEYTRRQRGTNKARATRNNILEINPFIEASVVADENGITPQNVRDYVENADIVIDAIDIRSLDMIFELHRYAAEFRKPVLVGYDLAGTAMVAVYRYDQERLQPLRGEFNQTQLIEFIKIKDAYRRGQISEADFLAYVYDAFTGPIPPLQVPLEQLEEIVGRDQNETRTFQIGTTSRVLSALVVETMREIIDGKSVRDVILVDVPSAVRSRNPNVLRKLPVLLRVLTTLRDRRHKVKEILARLEEKNG